MMAFSRKSSKTKKPSDKNNFNLEAEWETLKLALTSLVDFLDNKGQKKPFDNTKWMTYYDKVYKLCTEKVKSGTSSSGTKPPPFLYKKYGESINNYLSERVVPVLQKEKNILEEAVRRWNDHKLVVRYMEKLFNYLDMFFTKHNSIDNLKTVGLKAYYTYVYEAIKKNLCEALLEKIEAERNNELIERSQMKDGVELFREMGLGTLNAYKRDFEKPMLEKTELYYRKEAVQWINSDSAPTYLLKAETRLKQEEDRAKSYLDSSTISPLIKEVQKQLISQYIDVLLNMDQSGFKHMLENLSEKHTDIARMYDLFKKVDTIDEMSKMFREYVKLEGVSVVKEYSSEAEIDVNGYIEKLLAMHNKYKDLLNTAFQNDQVFSEAIKDAFTHFVNIDIEHSGSQTKTTTAELLSKYCNYVMKTEPTTSDSELGKLLDSIVDVFIYVSDKDMFQEYYRRQLSHRLLLDNANFSMEKDLISRLKRSLGASFTSKLEGMIKDKTISASQSMEFSNSSFTKDLSIDFTPTVLTMSFWPPFQISSLSLPPVMQDCIIAFKKFYDTTTEARSLKWVHKLGSTQLSARYKYGDREILMSTTQATIMLLFNTKNEYTVAEIREALSIPLQEFKTALLSLCVYKKTRLLLKTPNNHKLNLEDSFKLNEDFKSKMFRVKMKTGQSRFTNEDRTEIAESTRMERQSAIEAAIVRIMKSHKKMQHRNLTNEVVKQLMTHFKPDPKVIKRRIEDLISRDYLERDENDASLYHYIS
mmetsp:Transcript_9410/g.13919  ORF Transcript_9410/g.13919 Transcript_9410/m.13919 type:complete len:757 (+) Transcript_9410:92-2362(+)